MRSIAVRLVAGLVGLAGVSLAQISVGSPAVGSPPDAADPDCPLAYPVAELVDDQPVNGLTVARGTTPAAFTGTLVGVLENGIAPGIDMIIVDLTSPDIDGVGGIWSGMSGSPVYAADGRLIGAVSYGMAAGPSPIAGVTPAEAMYSDLAVPAAPATRLPASMRRQMVREGAATSAQADAGMARLPLPVGVSGVSPSRLSTLLATLGAKPRTTYSLTGAGSDADVTDIVPGGNLGVALSYGDISMAGVGTVTAVCGDEVLGFGHPMTWAGESAFYLQPASAIYIQDDPTFAPFKMANLADPVGTIDEDRLAAVHGLLGPVPISTVVTTGIGDGSTVRSADSMTASITDLPWIAATAQLAAQDAVFDAIAPGSTPFSITIDGETPGGGPFTVTHIDRIASRWDVSAEATWPTYSLLSALAYNRFTDVTISQVTIASEPSAEARQYGRALVDQYVAGTWKRLHRWSTIRVSGGQVLRLRITGQSYRDRFGSKTVLLDFQVGRRIPPGMTGYLTLLAGSEQGNRERVPDFDSLVAALNDLPRNDEIRSGLAWDAPWLTGAEQRTDFGDVIRIARGYPVRVTR